MLTISYSERGGGDEKRETGRGERVGWKDGGGRGGGGKEEGERSETVEERKGEKKETREEERGGGMRVCLQINRDVRTVGFLLFYYLHGVLS